MTEAIVYRRIDGLDLCLDVHTHQGIDHAPVVFWIHGGALIGGHRDNIKPWQRDWYRERGYAVVSVDYRLAPETKLSAIVDDMRAAWEWLHSDGVSRFGFDTRRVAVVGHSAGGYLALVCGYAVSPKPRALVSFYGYGDIIGPWYSEPDPFYCRLDPVLETEARAAIRPRPIANDGGDSARGRFYLWTRQTGRWPIEVAGYDPDTDAERFAPFMPIRNVTSDWPPTLLIHGQQDTDVPHAQSEIMADELVKHSVMCEFLSIPNAGHGFDGYGLADPTVAGTFGRVEAFLKKYV